MLLIYIALPMPTINKTKIIIICNVNSELWNSLHIWHRLKCFQSVKIPAEAVRITLTNGFVLW